MALYKDSALDRLAALGNVAQFVAWRPAGDGALTQSFARIKGYSPNQLFADIPAAIAALLRASDAQAVNIRSYLPHDPQSREFVYGLTSAAVVVAHLTRLAAQGLYLIVNEMIDIADGGVSGVVQGDLIEFAPDDTPRAVERPGIAAFPRDFGLDLLETVYGVRPLIPGNRADRVEFSVHPSPRGWHGTNTLLWEIEQDVPAAACARPRWPNNFSRHLGDKTFGLLMAAANGAAVPRTLVIGRRVAPFSFGRDTGSGEIWVRTSPREPQPGLYTTVKGWRDPFALLAAEDPDKEIVAVLTQAGVRALWSGAAIVGGDDRLIVEGTAGEGDAFMLGERPPEPIPADIHAAVIVAHGALSERLGPVRIEWVHDGQEVWVVQLHVGVTMSVGTTIVAGTSADWRWFDVADGLPALRAFLDQLPATSGIALRGEVGLTSHIADVLRKFGRPARLEPMN